MRQFSSYGPVNAKVHYAVPRSELVERCVRDLVGEPDDAGHYFTIWGPRQTGKTWIMRRAMEEIRGRYGERFLVKELSMQGVSVEPGAPPQAFLSRVPGLFRSYLDVKVPQPSSFEDWGDLFLKDRVFDRPLILLIDEFDRLPAPVIDELVTQFRALKLRQEGNLLHGLALVGVRAVLGVDSPRGSPFNVQRSLHVPNLTQAEVTDMFRQYQQESGQPVDAAVVQRLYEVTRGQPGLVSWFGELLTEAPPRDAPITLAHWERTYQKACFVVPNNTILNLLKKARDERYVHHVVELFKTSNIPFSFDEDWCNYLYLNGVIDHQEVPGKAGQPAVVCRFAAPFIQQRLFNGFSRDMAALSDKLPAVNPRSDLTSILQALDLPALLAHYREYLQRAKQSGKNPWQGHPKRADLHLREAVGHFHLHWWLTEACAGYYVITPEFPTGNGKVDLHLRYNDHSAVIEVKSFTSQAELPAQRTQAARYAKSRGLSAATLALFVPSDDDEVIRALTREDAVPVDGAPVHIHTVAIAAQ